MVYRLSAFGAELWSRLQQQPFGALAKRELEHSILDAATKAGLLHNKPDAVASSLSLSLTKANSYLTDLALRRPALSDAEGHTQLAALLAKAEILPDNRHLSFALHNPALKIWLDRKLAANQSHHGDGIRSNIAKLSPATLLSLLANSEANLQDPLVVFRQLEHKLGTQPWITERVVSLENRSLVLWPVSERAGSDRVAAAARGLCSALARSGCAGRCALPL